MDKHWYASSGGWTSVEFDTIAPAADLLAAVMLEDAEDYADESTKRALIDEAMMMSEQRAPYCKRIGHFTYDLSYL